MTFDATLIKVIGFDLDQTLYPKSPKIDESIQKYIYEKIAEHKNCTQEEARTLFTDLYKEGCGLSGSKTLEMLEIPNAQEIVQEALERADIASSLIPNQKTLELLHTLKKKYGNIDLITGSDVSNTTKKLEKLSIPKELFNYLITGEIATKSTGEAYILWFSKYPHLRPNEFLYIGDRVSSDYEAPDALGIKTILVNIKKEDPLLPVLQLSSLLDLKKIL